MKYINYLLQILFLLSAIGCGVNTYDAGDNRAVSGSTPSGTDTFSASTNRSDKEGETTPKLDPLSGAGYIKPPQINNYGTVNLSYPVDVPQGRAGIQPSVGLSYSSSGGDGLVGIGWSMGTGLGVISRTTRHGQLYYDHRDTFTFNGKRLVKVEGPANSEEGTYRLEIESGFSKLVLSDTDSGGIWRVYDKAGTVTTFGENKSSRIYRSEDDSKTYIWNYSRSVDLNGNYMYAVYDTSDYEDNHILYLKEIRYTGNIRTGHTAKQWVKFIYKKRDDAYVSKAPGFVMKMDRMLDRIDLGWDSGSLFTSDSLWQYEMVYKTSPDSHRPYLVTVNSSRNTTQPKFNYRNLSTDDRSLIWEKIYNPRYNDTELNPDATKYFEGDFNGDGISDMVFFNPVSGDWSAAQGRKTGGYTYPTYGNRFQGYDSEKKIKFFKGNVTGDYNGDGRSDIAMFLPETKEFIVAQHNGKIFEFVHYGTLAIDDLDIFKCEWFPGDYDGNGLSDAVLFNEPTGEWVLMRNMGQGFEFTKFAKNFQNLFRDDFNPNMYLNSESTFDESEYGKDRGKVHFLSGDYNGDGRSDITVYDSRSGKWFVGANYRKEGSVPFEFKWTLYKEFTAPEQTLFGNDRFSGDFNGDGYSDFLLFDRADGQWWLGETQNDTINFRKFSEAPKFKDITRWLQGDFNGDGRTDIGFYSKTDNCFWIGEAKPDGFTYKIYNDLNKAANAPDMDRVMRTPLPADEVKLADTEKIVAANGKTYSFSTRYDANVRSEKGETVFAGNFSGSGAELLIYRKNSIYKRSSNESLDAGYYTAIHGAENAEPVSDKSLTDVTGEGITLLGNSSPVVYNSLGLEGLLYYQKSGDDHEVSLLKKENGSWKENNVALFTENESSGFNIKKSLYFYDFIDSVTDKSFFLFKPGDTLGDARFLINGDTDSAIPLERDLSESSFTDEDLNNFLKSYPASRTSKFVFGGKFNGSDFQLLLIDTSTSTQKWYLGTFDGSIISFKKVTPSEDFTGSGYTGQYRAYNDGPNNGSLLYETRSNGVSQFRRISLDTDNYEAGSSDMVALSNGESFTGSYDHNGYPVVKTSTGYKVLANLQLSTCNFLPDNSTAAYQAKTAKRSDLMDAHYPFRWIQGDYNGDGKTDIGIFHLKEQNWYFANSQGTIPDMVYQVENGIGGKYTFEFSHSSRFDNTGDDDIPDLPMNYKVCTRLTVEDGRGDEISTKYEYSNGYAFSAFINGYKETDYFGFGTFKTIDAYGGKSVSTYNNVPYDDFRKNRSLAGAVKETVVFGSDHREYSRAEYTYKLHEIDPSYVGSFGQRSVSYLIEPVEVREYKNKILFQTKNSNIVLTPGKYEMISKTESVTDHYKDEVHSPVTVSSYQEFDNIEETNEMRLKVERDLTGSSHEVTSSYLYDDRGNVTREEKAYTGTGLTSAAPQVMEYEYDSYGNRTVSRNLSGSPARETQTSFDEPLHQFAVTQTVIGDSRNYLTKFTINYGIAFGGVEKKEDENGNSTYYTFDDYGRLEKQETDADSSRDTIATYNYSTDFPLRGTVEQHTGTDDAHTVTSVYADGMGRSIHSVRAEKLDGSVMKVTKTGLLKYDSIGRLISKSQTHWGSENDLYNFIPNTTVKYPTLTQYDAAGRVLKVISPKNNSSEVETSVTNIYTYDNPWVTTATHSIGRSKTTVSNSRGQVLYVTDTGTGDGNGAVTAKMGFAYDIAGNRIKKMDLNSTTMSLEVESDKFQVARKDTSGHNKAYWRYDGFGRVVESSDPDLGYTKVEYDDFGAVKNQTDALGRITSFTYDRLGRVTVKTLPASAGQVTYHYDEESGCDNAISRLVKVVDPSQTKIMSYDRLGRVKRETRKLNVSGVADDTFITDFTFDMQGRKKTITYPEDPTSGRRISITHTYGFMGVTSLKSGNDVSKDIVKAIEYNEFGQLTRILRGNDTNTVYTYDIRGRLTNLRTVAASSGKELQNVTYDFRIDNSVSAREDYISDRYVRYEYKYDGLNRLTAAQGRFGADSETISKRFQRGYSYAQNGNLTGKDIFNPESGTLQDSWVYHYSNHAATGIDTTAHGTGRFTMNYDDVGNMIYQHDAATGKKKEMNYDWQNRVSRVMDPDTGTLVGQYWYDDNGFRVRKLALRESEGQEYHMEVLYPSMYFGMEQQKTLSGHDVPDSQTAVNNIYLNGVRVAAMAPGGKTLYYLTDQVDSVNVVTDDDANTVSRFEYLPYGSTWVEEGEDKHNPKYNSQELDKETGYYYYNARHYDPEIARFVTADNVIDGQMDTQGWNRYSYVKGNPIVYKDPTGHWTLKGAWESIKEKASSAQKAVQKFDKKLNGKLKSINNTLDKTAKRLMRSASKVSKRYGKPAGVGLAVAALVVKAGEIALPDSTKGGSLAVLSVGAPIGRVGKIASSANKSKKTYQTYTKFKKETGQTYTGRTSGKGSPFQNVAKRDKRHHKNKDGYGPAKLDASSTNKSSIRGREQLLIEKHGGAKSKEGSSGNTIQGISDKNPRRSKYLNAAKKEFDDL